jgi:hypothetical protein
MDRDEIENIVFFKAISFINKSKFLPDNVFLTHWKEYLFFEDWWMWNECFIEVKNLLLREDGGSTIALVNLAKSLMQKREEQAIFLDKYTKWSEYHEKLHDDRDDLPWSVMVDRYSCTSDTGNWVIYVEKEEDMAIFAFNEKLPKSICDEVSILFKAKSISLAMVHENDESFNFQKLLPNWRSTLIQQYGKPGCDP